MNTMVRDLYYQIMTAIANAEGQPDLTDGTWITQVTNIIPGVKGMLGIQGVRVEPGLKDVPIRSGVYLAKTYHRRGDRAVAIYNICVMDSAGDIRLLIDTRQDSRTYDCTKSLRTFLTDLIQEHDELNGRDPPPSNLLQDALEDTAELIKALNPDRWAGWILHLLEALDDEKMPHQYELFLSHLDQTIQSRLNTGRWYGEP